jgi:hypothetical protein
MNIGRDFIQKHNRNRGCPRRGLYAASIFLNNFEKEYHDILPKEEYNKLLLEKVKTVYKLYEKH